MPPPLVVCLISCLVWFLILVGHPIKTETVDYTEKVYTIQYEGKNYLIKDKDWKLLIPVLKDKYQIKQVVETSFFGVSAANDPYLEYKQ